MGATLVSERILGPALLTLCHVYVGHSVEVHTVRKGVDTKAVYGIGSTPGYVTTQQANWGAARPFTSLHQYARYVPTFPDGARLG